MGDSDLTPLEAVEGLEIYTRTEMGRVKKMRCPECGRSTRRVKAREHFSIRVCKGPSCRRRGDFFVGLNGFMHNEFKFSARCRYCGEKLTRRLARNEEGELLLAFRCDSVDSKLCAGASEDPFTYNLTRDRWEGNIPTFEEDIDSYRLPEGDKEELKRKARGDEICPVGDMPLLTMRGRLYEKFVEAHHGRAVAMVDVPNLVRTLREYHLKDFEDFLRDSRLAVLDLIFSKMDTVTEHIIHYFSNPSEDLGDANAIFSEHCDGDWEMFHSLEARKFHHGEYGYGDIDSYLVANAISILTLCDLKGLLLVTSDKDFLPVVRYAKLRRIPCFIVGANPAADFSEWETEVLNLLETVTRLRKKR
jgi:uncharacterized LabA/DUF88 family protein